MKRRHSREYRTYLESEAWRERKQALFNARGRRCERCGVRAGQRYDNLKPIILHVHHLTYIRLGHELDSDLQILCGPCHREADKERRRIRQIDRHHRHQSGRRSRRRRVAFLKLKRGY